MSSWKTQKSRSLVFLLITCYMWVQFSSVAALATSNSCFEDTFKTTTYDYNIVVAGSNSSFSYTLKDSEDKAISPDFSNNIQFDSNSGHLTIKDLNLKKSLFIKSEYDVTLANSNLDQLDLSARDVFASGQVNKGANLNVKNLTVFGDLTLRFAECQIENLFTILKAFTFYMQRTYLTCADINRFGNIHAYGDLEIYDPEGKFFKTGTSGKDATSGKVIVDGENVVYESVEAMLVNIDDIKQFISKTFTCKPDKVIGLVVRKNSTEKKFAIHANILIVEQSIAHKKEGALKTSNSPTTRKSIAHSINDILSSVNEFTINHETDSIKESGQRFLDEHGRDLMLGSILGVMPFGAYVGFILLGEWAFGGML